MLRKNQWLGAVLLTACCAQSAVAVSPGFYLGGQMSYSVPDNRNFYYTYDAKSLGVGFNFGYNFSVSPEFLLGFELGSNYLGKFDASPNYSPYYPYHYYDYANQQKYVAQRYFAVGSFLLTGTLVTDNNFDLFVKYGRAAEVYASNSAILNISHGFMIAGGITFNLTPQLDLDLQYSHVFGGDHQLRFDTILFGLTYFLTSKHEDVVLQEKARAFMQQVNRTQDDSKKLVHF